MPPKVLVYLGPGQRDIYVMRWAEGKVGVASESDFWMISRYGALAKVYPDPSIDMTLPKNNSHDPGLAYGAHGASFRNMNGALVKVEW